MSFDMIASNLLCSFVLMLLIRTTESCSSALRLQQLQSNQLVGQDDSTDSTSNRATRVTLAGSNNFMQNEDSPATSISDVPQADSVDQSTLNCSSFGLECAWKTSNDSSVPWYQSELPIESVVLQVATGTTIPPNGSYAIALTEEVLDPKAWAVLESSVIPCQEGAGHLLLSYWSSTLVQVNFCTMIVGEQEFYFCTTLMPESEPGPVYLSIPDHNGRPFKMYIIADHFTYTSDQYSGGFVIVDDITYIGESCTANTTPPQANNFAQSFLQAIRVTTTLSTTTGINFSRLENTQDTTYEENAQEEATTIQVAKETSNSGDGYISGMSGGSHESTIFPTLNIEGSTNEMSSFEGLEYSSTSSGVPPFENQEESSGSTVDVEGSTSMVPDEEEPTTPASDVEEEIITLHPSFTFILPRDVTSSTQKIETRDSNEQTEDNPADPVVLIPSLSPQVLINKPEIETDNKIKQEPFTQNYPFYTSQTRGQTEEEVDDVTPTMTSDKQLVNRVPDVPFYQRLFNGSSSKVETNYNLPSTSNVMQSTTPEPIWYQFTSRQPLFSSSQPNPGQSRWNPPNVESLFPMSSSTTSNHQFYPFFPSATRNSPPEQVFQPSPSKQLYTKPQFPPSLYQSTVNPLFPWLSTPSGSITLFPGQDVNVFTTPRPLSTSVWTLFPNQPTISFPPPTSFTIFPVARPFMGGRPQGTY